MTRSKNAPRIVSPGGSTHVDAPAPTAIARNLMPPPQPLSTRAFVGRALFPLVTLVLITGTALWGAWITLALAVVTWAVVGRLG